MGALGRAPPPRARELPRERGEPCATSRSPATSTRWRDATFVVEAIVEEHRGQGRAVSRELARDPGRRTRCSPPPPRALSVGELAAASGRPERFVGLHVFNPVTEDGAGRARLPGRGERRDPRARPRAVRGARQDRRSRCPTCPASSSTGCCSRTCSTPCALLERTGLDAEGDRHLHEARRRPPDGAAARCSTSSGSTSSSRSARRSTSRCPPRVDAADRRGRARAARPAAASTPTSDPTGNLSANCLAQLELRVGSTADARDELPSSQPLLQKHFAAGSLP